MAQVDRAAAGGSLLQVVGIQKRFGGVVALADVDLEIRAGECHALVGENGAGKSTLMKVLSGAHTADAGELLWLGQPFQPSGPIASRDAGIAMIYQELNLAPDLTVAQNVMLGREVAGSTGLVNRRRQDELVMEALRFVGDETLRPDQFVRDLGPGERQLVEIARALVGDAQLIVMDEPTSSLSRHDTERLFQVVDRLKERGVAVIYISHFLEELDRIADRYTVLRDGRTVAVGAMAGVTHDELIEHMVGRSIDEVYPTFEPVEPGEVLLEFDGVAGEGQPRDASLTVRRGEIVGIAGLVGAGRTELLRCLMGLDEVRSGRVLVGGSPLEGAVPARLDRGVGMLSEDRKTEGLALGLSVAVNTTLSRLRPFVRGGLVSGGARDEAVTGLVDRLAIRCAGPSQPVEALSGGNQQKVALARLVHHDVDVVLLDEPTRGVDVGSKVEIYRLLGEWARAGKAVLMVSSYIPELLGVCDRIAVMHRGVLGTARTVADWDENALLEAAALGGGAS